MIQYSYAFFLMAGVLCVIGAILMQRQEARRIWNGFVMLLGILFVFHGILGYIAIRYRSASDSAVWMVIGTALVSIVPLLTLVLGIYLIINGIRLFRREGISISHSLPLVFGVAAVAGSILFCLYSFNSWSMSAFGIFCLQAIYQVALIVPISFATFAIFSLMYYLKKKDNDVDYIIVLGCGIQSEQVTPLLRGRLDKAIKCYHAGGERAVFIVSGGQGRDEPVSEAFAMRKYLLTQNIPDDQIIMEDQSKTTRENLRFSKKIMQEQKKNATCLIATNNYHTYRAALISRYVDMRAQSVGGKTATYYAPAAYLREAVAVIFSYKRSLLFFVLIMIAYAYLNVYLMVPNIIM